MLWFVDVVVPFCQGWSCLTLCLRSKNRARLRVLGIRLQIWRVLEYIVKGFFTYSWGHQTVCTTFPASSLVKSRNCPFRWYLWVFIALIIRISCCQRIKAATATAKLRWYELSLWLFIMQARCVEKRICFQGCCLRVREAHKMQLFRCAQYRLMRLILTADMRHRSVVNRVQSPFPMRFIARLEGTRRRWRCSKCIRIVSLCLSLQACTNLFICPWPDSNQTDVQQIII